MSESEEMWYVLHCHKDDSHVLVDEASILSFEPVKVDDDVKFHFKGFKESLEGTVKGFSENIHEMVELQNKLNRDSKPKRNPSLKVGQPRRAKVLGKQGISNSLKGAAPSSSKGGSNNKSSKSKKSPTTETIQPQVKRTSVLGTLLSEEHVALTPPETVGPESQNDVGKKGDKQNASSKTLHSTSEDYHDDDVLSGNGNSPPGNDDHENSTKANEDASGSGGSSESADSDNEQDEGLSVEERAQLAALMKKAQKKDHAVLQSLQEKSRKRVTSQTSSHSNDDEGSTSKAAKTSRKKRPRKELTKPPQFEGDFYRYNAETPNAEELSPGSGVYISKQDMKSIKKNSNTRTSLARKLVTKVFSDEAIQACSVSGKYFKGCTRRPALDPTGVEAIIDFVQSRGNKKRFEPIRDSYLKQSMGNVLSDIRSTAQDTVNNEAEGEGVQE